MIKEVIMINEVYMEQDFVTIMIWRQFGFIHGEWKRNGVKGDGFIGLHHGQLDNSFDSLYIVIFSL